MNNFFGSNELYSILKTFLLSSNQIWIIGQQLLQNLSTATRDYDINGYLYIFKNETTIF